MRISDKRLEESFLYWLAHYTGNGDKHYSDTKDEKIIEIYFELIVGRVLEEFPEMSNDKIVERIYQMF